MNSRKLGLEIHIADLLIKRAGDRTKEIRNEKQLTGTHGYILGYLAKHQDAPVYQKDIEQHFGIRRSSASNVLTLMEKNGLVERHSVKEDARLKRIVMTEKGEALHRDTVSAFERIAAQAVEGVDEKDLEVFYNVLNAIQRNLGGEDEDK
ncbi:MAG: MarR family transcriptional regulator [Clostridia bacterium]|nr:MarR family transcriptional regulator [Clostridia bacterium]